MKRRCFGGASDRIQQKHDPMLSKITPPKMPDDGASDENYDLEMSDVSLTQKQPLLKTNFKNPLISSFKKGKFFKYMFVRCMICHYVCQNKPLNNKFDHLCSKLNGAASGKL